MIMNQLSLMGNFSKPRLSTPIANPSICAQCYEKGQSCCTYRKNTTYDMITIISKFEINRILQVFPRLNRSKAFVEKTNTKTFEHNVEELFPDRSDAVMRSFMPGKTHFELSTTEKGCRFLTPKGCVLPRDARPLFCRIYPFWFRNNEAMVFFDTHCLAIKNCSTIQEVYLAIGTNPSVVKKIFIQLCCEWGLEKSEAKVAGIL